MRRKNVFLFNVLIIILSLHTMSWAASTRAPANANPLPADILHHPPMNADNKILVAVAFHLINLSGIDENDQHFNMEQFVIMLWQFKLILA